MPHYFSVLLSIHVVHFSEKWSVKQDHFFYQRFHGQKNARDLIQKDIQRGLKTILEHKWDARNRRRLFENKKNMNKKGQAIINDRLKMKGDCWFSKRWIHDYIPPVMLVWYFFISANHHLHIMIICIRLRKFGIYSEIDSSCEGFLSIDKDAFQSSSASISSRSIRIISFIQFIISAQTEQMIISVINLEWFCWVEGIEL